MFYQVVLCVFSQEQIGRGHVYIEYTQKVLKVLLLKVHIFVRVKCEFIFFPGKFFMYYKQKWSSRRVVKIMCPCATPLPRQLLPGGEPCIECIFIFAICKI